MIYDCVLTVDHPPSLCGTAKFSHQLAQRLGVPCVTKVGVSDRPLVSVRASEMTWTPFRPKQFDLFLHDAESGSASCEAWVKAAGRVWAANADIADQLRPWRPDVLVAFAPSTIQGTPSRGAISVLTFGMAHKLRLPPYRRLADLLHGRDYTIEVSTAVHEGSPWDATAQVGAALRTIFQDRVRVLGYLADDALVRELQACSVVAVFFDPALRENNTTFWAAHASGKPIVTNLDERSPFVGSGVYDISAIQNWGEVRPVRGGGRQTRYTWDRLLDVLGIETPCAS